MEEFIDNYTLYNLASKFKYEGKPYRLDEYRQFLPFFKDRRAQTQVGKTGRQLGKTTMLAATAHARAMLTPNFRTIAVEPIEKQAKDFAWYRLDDFKRNSPIIQNMITRDNWSRKGYTNGSSIMIEYILNNISRVEGLSGDLALLDEFQSYDSNVMPIFTACLAASEYELYNITGVPKTTTNILSEAFDNSSQAEWVTPCHHCNYENIASVKEDLLNMIGPESPICAKCGRDIDPSSEKCFYLHTAPENLGRSEGYHIPQVVISLHYKSLNNAKWYSLLDDQKNWEKSKFLNERLGEACDTGKVILSPKDLQKCCTLDLPDMNAINKRIKKIGYDMIFTGIDWGGYGKENISRTAEMTFGVKPIDTGLRIDCLHYEIFSVAMSDHEIIETICNTINNLKIEPRKKIVMHDLGAGQIYGEDLMRNLGIPSTNIVGTELFLDPEKDVIIPMEPSEQRPRPYYRINKTKSSMLFAKAIRHQKTNFDQWERFQKPAEDLISIELEESKHSNSQILRVVRTAHKSDDLFQAGNQALQGILYRYNAYAGFFDPETLRY